MPRLEDEGTQTPLLAAVRLEAQRLEEHEITKTAYRAWGSFANFALRDNVLEVAVGLILAASFTALSNSLVTDIILPVISLLPFISRNLEERFTVLRRGENYQLGYNTKAQALDDGAIIWAWGSFLDKLLRFFLVAISLWIISRIYGFLAKDNIIKRQIRCRYCRKYISERALRCVNCSSWQDGREDIKP